MLEEMFVSIEFAAVRLARLVTQSDDGYVSAAAPR